MAEKKTAGTQTDVAAVRDKRTQTVLDMATGETKTVFANREAGSVSATASLSVSDNDGKNTTKDGASATVTLETSHSVTPNEASK
jgi:hypothetical protein